MNKKNLLVALAVVVALLALVAAGLSASPDATILGCFVVVLFVVPALAALVAFARTPRPVRQVAPVDYICRECGTVGAAELVPRGSFAIELVLWCCAIIPGAIYSAWSRSPGALRRRCRSCRHDRVVLATSPRGRQLRRELSLEPSEAP